jgi:tocopherol O-methyltransferase
MEQPSQEDIIRYYDTCETNYRRWWDLDRSLAMHAGFWDKTTSNLTDALKHENEILAEMIGIRPEDRILDAGCGVGGSSIFLANRYGCQVTGITLSEQQRQLATHKAAERNLAKPPQFLIMDYTKTSFADESFDVVWAIESVCHAKDKRDFIREAWRVLKKGGRLVVADGFNVRNEYTDKERTLLDKMVNGWAVSSMESIPNFQRYLEEQGFTAINQRDCTHYVLPSSRRLFLYSFPALAWSKIGEYLGWSTPVQTQDFQGYHYQFWAVRKGLCQYIVFTATKP